MSAPEPFGQTPDGRAAALYTLRSKELRVRITDYGGRMVSIDMAERPGRFFSALLGFDEVAQYAKAGGAFGALLGRCANRIADGDLPIDGTHYQLPVNDKGVTLHGGPQGFDKATWIVAGATDDTLTLAYTSRDGEQGFPGELHVEAAYRVVGPSLSLTFTARTTRPTAASLSAHPYFNLAGAASGDILGHEVTIAADRFLVIDEHEIPTGMVRPVGSTPLDFRRPIAIGSRIRQADPQLLRGQGYDHYYILRSRHQAEPRFAAKARDPASGRFVEVRTTQPGVQFYTGNQLNGSVAGHDRIIYRQSAGLSFEPQGFPDAPHHPDFPSTILRPGTEYREIIEYRFGVE